MLIELYGPIDTGVIIWITNIIGKIDCISFYLPSFDPRFDRHRAFLTFFPRDIQIDVISMYFIFARTFDLVRIFFFFFFFFSFFW